MTASIIAYTPTGSGKAQAESVTIGANTGDVPYVLQFESQHPTYTVVVQGVSIAGANDHLAQVMAGSALKVRITRIKITQSSNAGAANVGSFSFIRLTSAGTGGTVLTPATSDPADSPSGAAGMSLPTVKGSESTILRVERMAIRSAVATNAGGDAKVDWGPPTDRAKAYTIAAGVTNGFAVKNLTAVASATVDIMIDLLEMAY